MNDDIDMPVPKEFGPHQKAVAEVFNLVQSGHLFRFKGALSDRFLPVTTLATAQQIAFDPSPNAFHWVEDRKTLWKQPEKANVLGSPDARALYKGALNKLDTYIFQVIEEQIPPKMYEVCYSQVCEDLIGIARCLVAYGELDIIDQMALEAYRQGGWPCGATGPRPKSESDEFGERKIYVYWKDDDK